MSSRPVLHDLLLNLRSTFAVSNCASLHHICPHFHCLRKVTTISFLFVGCLEVAWRLYISALLLLQIVLDREVLQVYCLAFTEHFLLCLRPLRVQPLLLFRDSLATGRWQAQQESALGPLAGLTVVIHDCFGPCLISNLSRTLFLIVPLLGFCFTHTHCLPVVLTIEHRHACQLPFFFRSELRLWSHTPQSILHDESPHCIAPIHGIIVFRHVVRDFNLRYLMLLQCCIGVIEYL